MNAILNNEIQGRSEKGNTVLYFLTAKYLQTINLMIARSQAKRACCRLDRFRDLSRTPEKNSKQQRRCEHHGIQIAQQRHRSEEKTDEVDGGRQDT